MLTMPPMPQTQNPANKPDPAPDARPADRTPPRVWVVTGYRAGERTQILGLADALGWPYEIKALGHRSWDWAPGLARRVSIAGIDPDSRAALNPPWPDLVISAGMRNEPVVRWIKARSDRQTKLVHLGRPWVHYRHLDLVITTPQYRLPDRADVLQNLGTLHRVNPHSLAAAGQRWAAAFADPECTMRVDSHRTFGWVSTDGGAIRSARLLAWRDRDLQTFDKLPAPTLPPRPAVDDDERIAA